MIKKQFRMKERTKKKNRPQMSRRLEKPTLIIELSQTISLILDVPMMDVVP